MDRRISNSGPTWRGSSGGENGAGWKTSFCMVNDEFAVLLGGQPGSFIAAARVSGAVLGILVVGPDVDDLVQRADLGVPEGG